MSTKTAVLDQFLEPVLSVELARKLADFRADEQIQARVDDLARKCNEGLLTPAEKAEYEAIVEDADVIALLQAKARAVLADAAR
jgi:protein-L-isoaspartate O-methyltransferase